MESSYARVTQGLLAEWARWHYYRSGEVRGYPHEVPFYRLFRAGGIREALVTDEEAERIDRAVAKLSARCPDQAAVLKLYYLEGMTIQTIARKTGYRTRAAQLLRQAETAIEWILDITIID